MVVLVRHHTLQLLNFLVLRNVVKTFSFCNCNHVLVSVLVDMGLYVLESGKTNLDFQCHSSNGLKDCMLL